MRHKKSTAYYSGYQAYEIWYINQTDPKPINPFNTETDADSAEQWYQGWVDASFDT